MAKVAKKKGKYNPIPDNVLQDIRKRNRNHYLLARWLFKNHKKVFKRKAVKEKDYVVALVPKDGALDSEPELRFFSNKSQMLVFIKEIQEKDVCVFDYRYSHKMQLMY